jgi:small subunit ribosomal protein S8
MALNDPLGDMIARIHNAQMRNKSKVSMPSSRQRERARVRGPAKSIIRDRTVLQPWAFFWDSSRSQQYTRAA